MTELIRNISRQLFIIAWFALLVSIFVPRQYILADFSGKFGLELAQPLVMYVYLSDIALLALLFAGIFRIWAAKDEFGLSKLFLLPFFLVIWYFARSLSAEFPILANYGSFRVLQGVLLFWVGVYVLRSTRVIGVSAVLLLFLLCVQSIIGLLQAYYGVSAGLQILGESVLALDMPAVAKVNLAGGGKILRAYGLFAHPNIFGGYLVLLLYLFIWWFLRQRGLRRYFLASLPLLGAALFLTYSRSAWLSAAILLLLSFVAAVVIKDKQLFNRLKRAVPAFLAGIVVVLIFIPGSSAALYSRVAPPSGDMYAEERARGYNYALRFFYDSPLVGVGPNNYVAKLAERVSPGTELRPWEYEYPHNAPLIILVETGIIGLTIAIISITAIIKAAAVNKTAKISWLVLMISMLPLLLFDHYLWSQQDGRLLLWLVLAFQAGIIYWHPKYLKAEK